MRTMRCDCEHFVFDLCVEQEVSNIEISGTWGGVFEVDASATELKFIGGEERAVANAMNQSSGMLVFCPLQTVMLLPHSTSMRAALSEKGELYDQFGPITNQPLSSRLVVTLGFSGGAVERPLHTACCILSDSHRCQVAAHCAVEGYELWIHIDGDTCRAQRLAMFWQRIVPASWLQFVGLDISTAMTGQQHSVVFAPQSNRCPVPFPALQQHIIVCGVRSLLLCLGSPPAVPVRLLLKGRPLFSGELSSSISIRTILDLIQMVFEPFGLQGPSGVLHNGRNLLGDCILGQCAPNQPAGEVALLLFERPN